jgi:hypothetical protein
MCAIDAMVDAPTDAASDAALDAALPTVLSSSEAEPLGLISYSNYLLWVDNGTMTNNYQDGSVVRLDIASGTRSVIAANQQAPMAVATDGSYIYWTLEGTAPGFTDGSVMRIPWNGQTIETFAGNQTQPWAIVLTSSAAFWTTFSGIMTKPLAGGTVQLFSSAQSNSLATDNSVIYWGDGSLSAILEESAAGGTSSTLAPNQLRPTSLVVDQGMVYWAVNASNGSVVGVSTSGGSTTTYASNLFHPQGLTFDNDNLYLAVPPAGRILKASRAAPGMTQIVAEGLVDGPTSLVSVGSFLYVTTAGAPDVASGSLLRISK